MGQTINRDVHQYVAICTSVLKSNKPVLIILFLVLFYNVNKINTLPSFFFTFASFKCFYFSMLSLSYQYNNGKLTKKCVHNSENKTHGTDHGESDVVLCSDFLAGAGPWDPMVPEGGAVNPLRGGGQGVVRLSGRGRGHGPGRPYRVGAHGHYMVMMLVPSRSQH